MLQSLVFEFVQAWLLGFIALLAGRYLGKRKKVFPASLGRKLFLYAQVWSVTFLMLLFLTPIGRALALPEHLQSGLAEFLLPIAAGTCFAHMQLLRLQSRTKLPPITTEEA